VKKKRRGEGEERKGGKGGEGDEKNEKKEESKADDTSMVTTMNVATMTMV